MDAPVGQLMNIVVDCPDAGISARFWAAVLGWKRVQENAGWADIADASGGRGRLVFQQIADYRPPGWPDQGPPQQLHLDVRVDDLQIAGQRVRALGAVPLGERVVLEDETYRGLRRPGRTPVLSRAARNHLNRGAFIPGRPRPSIRSPTRRAPRRGPGQYPANGVMTYRPSAQDGSWQETCTLPSGEKEVCTAALNTFVSW